MIKCSLFADVLLEVYYTVLASLVRALRNAVGVELEDLDFVGSKSCDASLRDVSVLGCQKILAMGHAPLEKRHIQRIQGFFASQLMPPWLNSDRFSAMILRAPLWERLTVYDRADS